MNFVDCFKRRGKVGVVGWLFVFSSGVLVWLGYDLGRNLGL